MRSVSVARLRAVAIGLVVVTSMAGCGGTSATNGSADVNSMISLKNARSKRRTRYSPTLARTLAREPIPGGYLSFFAERYEYENKAYVKVGVRKEEQGAHGLVVGGGGAVSMKPDEDYGRALMQVKYYSCGGTHAYALAYGVIREQNDTVTARVRGKSLTLRKGKIPAALGVNGALVYALLPTGWPITLITQSPRGRVVREESYRGRTVCR